MTEVHVVRGEGPTPEAPFGVAVSEFNASICDALLEGALTALKQAGVTSVTVVHVPGALELPLACAQLLDSGHVAAIAIGVVIEGETDHYQHIAEQSAAGLTEVSLSRGAPVTNAILTVRDVEHAHARSQPGPSNKGHEAAEAAIRTVNALENLAKRPGGVS